MPSHKTIRTIATRSAWRSLLLRWYARAGRDLPWRHTRDPYRIWISEIMLQQTQVDRVIAYYERFLAKFPNVESLAKARWPQVLSVWRGTGLLSPSTQPHAHGKSARARLWRLFP